MAQSIKLGNNTYLDASGVTVNSTGETLPGAINGLRVYDSNYIEPGNTYTFSLVSGGVFILLLYRASVGESTSIHDRMYMGYCGSSGGHITPINTNTGTQPTIAFGERQIAVTNNNSSAQIVARLIVVSSSW